MRLSFSEITDLIRKTIYAYDPTAKIILYGSRARGDAREDSDWDVLTIINKENVSREDTRNMGYNLWEKGIDVGEEINNFIYTSKQWDDTFSMFKFHVRDEGILL